MNCDPNYLSQQASSLLSLSDSTLQGAQIALTCAWFNALGGGGSTPGQLLLAASSEPGIVRFTITNGSPAPSTGYLIAWGTTPGGPYPNSKSWALADAKTLAIADGLAYGTTYYFVIYGVSGVTQGPVSAEVSGGPQPPLPAGLTTGLLIRNEAFVFAGLTGAVASWSDLSGNGKHWATNVTNVNLDLAHQVTGTYGTYPTPLWNGIDSRMQQPFFFAASGYTGLEFMIVYRETLSPPTPGTEASAVAFNRPINFPSHNPYTDGTFYEGFARTARPACNVPAASLTTFRLYNASVAADGTSYNLWLGGNGAAHENFYSIATGYTFQQQGLETTAAANIGGPNYSLGQGWRYDIPGTVYTMTGNIVCLYAWSRQLSGAERTAMRNYITNLYGV